MISKISIGFTLLLLARAEFSANGAAICAVDTWASMVIGAETSDLADKRLQYLYRSLGTNSAQARAILECLKAQGYGRNPNFSATTNRNAGVLTSGLCDRYPGVDPEICGGAAEAGQSPTVESGA